MWYGFEIWQLMKLHKKKFKNVLRSVERAVLDIERDQCDSEKSLFYCRSK